MSRPQKNNADYFSHDCRMRDHRKIKLIRSKFWNAWYWIFCMLLEILTDSEWFKISIEWLELDLISQDLMISSKELLEILDFMKQLWLLQTDQEWLIYNQHLIDRMQPLLNKRELMRQKYERQNQPPPVKKEIVKQQKMSIQQFEMFWDKYPIKQGKKKAEWKFLKIDPKIFNIIMDWIDKHQKGEKWQKWFIPMPETFINQERRNDEVPEFILNNPAKNEHWRTHETAKNKVSWSWSADVIV